MEDEAYNAQFRTVPTTSSSKAEPIDLISKKRSIELRTILINFINGYLNAKILTFKEFKRYASDNQLLKVLCMLYPEDHGIQQKEFFKFLSDGGN